MDTVTALSKLTAELSLGTLWLNCVLGKSSVIVMRHYHVTGMYSTAQVPSSEKKSGIAHVDILDGEVVAVVVVGVVTTPAATVVIAVIVIVVEVVVVADLVVIVVVLVVVV